MLFWKEINALFDYRIYVDVDLETAVQRLGNRHAEVWGWSLQQGLDRARGSDYRNMILVEKTKHKADLVVRND